MKINLIETTNFLYNELKTVGICFNINGYPVFPKDIFLKELPNEIIPFSKRKYAVDKEKTLVCFFEEDEYLYRFLKNPEIYLGEFKGFLGIGGFDLSPNIFWPATHQRVNILISQMITLYVALKGNTKIIPNWRIGDLGSLGCLNSYPKNSMFIVGTLGSRHVKTAFDKIYLKSKILVSSPSTLLVYGVSLKGCKSLLEEENIECVFYEDYKSRAFRKKEAS